MRYSTIIYARTIPTGSYSNEKLGVEIELSEDDDPVEAFDKAKKLIEKIHKENNPQLYGVQQSIKVPAEIPNTHLQPEPEYKTAIQLLKEKQDKEIDGYIAAINLAENEKTLKLYLKRVLENNDPSNQKHTALRMAYELKSEQLKA